MQPLPTTYAVIPAAVRYGYRPGTRRPPALRRNYRALRPARLLLGYQ